MNKKPNIINKSEFAKLIGCRPETISRLINRGELTANSQGKIDIGSSEMKTYISKKKLEMDAHRNKLTNRIIKSHRLQKETENLTLKSRSSQDQVKSFKVSNIVEKEDLKNKNLILKNTKIQDQVQDQVQSQEINSNESLENIEVQTASEIEIAIKKEKLKIDKLKKELVAIELKEKNEEVVSIETMHKILSRTIIKLMVNLTEKIPHNLVDEIIYIIQTEENSKHSVINLLTNSIRDEIELTIKATEKEFKS